MSDVELSRLLVALTGAVIATAVALTVWAVGSSPLESPAALAADTAVLSTSTDLLPACEVEDASYGPSPCLWHADSQGNGVGTTVYVESDDAPALGVSWYGVSQDSYGVCAYWDGWGEPECVVAGMRQGDETLVDTMSRIGY